ncbi:MAG: alpha/beta hydrolase fold domain-containing protein [Nitrospiraceae bacterium]|nr:alpha/beta hydrolase fold domain-containing protein [Nitrospiraceae bacterium]
MMRRLRFVTVALAGLCVALGMVSAAAESVKIEKNLVYVVREGADGKKLQLRYDIARPLSGEGPFPLIVCVHAGGWQLGDKKSYRAIMAELASDGYVAVTVNYRTAPKFKWPAQLEDVRTAIRFFRAKADEFNIDPARVGLVGDDCGGHLSMMAGLVAAEEEKDTPIEQSSRVQAVVNFFGAPDLREARVESDWVAAQIFIAFQTNFDGIMADLLGTKDRNAPIYVEASPFSHVSAGAPPILSVIGTADPILKLGPFKTFHQSLRDAGVAEELLIVEGAKHSNKSIDKYGGAIAKMHAFFDKHVKGSASGQ